MSSVIWDQASMTVLLNVRSLTETHGDGQRRVSVEHRAAARRGEPGQVNASTGEEHHHETAGR